MKKTLTLALLLVSVFAASAQHKQIDTLRAALSKAATDTDKYEALRNLGNLYYIFKADSSIIFDQRAFLIAKKHSWQKLQSSALNGMANAYATMGDYATAIQYYQRALKINEALNNEIGISTVNGNIGATYSQKEDYDRALPYLQKALQQFYHYRSSHKLVGRENFAESINQVNLGECYLYLKKVDSAKYYLDAALKSGQKLHYRDVLGSIQRDLGEVEQLKGNKTGALQYFRQAESNDRAIGDVQNMSIAYLSMAKFYHQDKKQDSAEYYAQKALDTAAAGQYLQDVLNAGKALYSYYDEDHNLPAAYKYFKISTAAKDSLYSQDKVKQMLNIDFDEKMRQQEIAEAEIHYRDKVRLYILIAGMAVLVLLAFIFWRANKARTKAYKLLHKQKEEIDLQKTKVEHTLGELKATQTQLVQREKMASLGELTAGIAHEIQNPLNFVNNFSDVNQEMLEELKAESQKPKAERDEQLEVGLINDLIENEKKINHHGKRADFIVKGMLQHSRTGTGEKQPTYINILADEFLKLSYHGLRAKDKSFNAEMVTNFDKNLPQVNAVQQDIGRVLLNLFNNAFYAVNQKQKTAGTDYKPEVTVSTSTENGQVVIKVKDNGNGIAENIKDKIMQPFFTTKPTGEGTGLGLSLSYDILVKGHNGTLNVISNEGEGSEFIVKLPNHQS